MAASIVIPIMLAPLMAGALSEPLAGLDTQGSDTHEALPAFDLEQFDGMNLRILGSEGFLNAHPDQKFRFLGQEAREQGRYGDAVDHFMRAAKFADKLSQGALAEMYWNGEGIPRDRARAYAWMDLAAERGAPFLLAHRERYWSGLSAGERQQAIELGRDLYEYYGDAVAKPRLERILVVARRRVTGSRVGFIGNLSICIREPGNADRCDTSVRGDEYYDDRLWKPEQYWQWQDRIIRVPDKQGTVEVGPLQPVRGAEPEGR